jgi:hypothetical protein
MSQYPNITHMKYHVICTLILAGVLIAGCTSAQPPPATFAPTTVPVVTTVATTIPQPSFEIGDQYLDTQYNFNSQTNGYTEQFMVNSQSWGIKIQVSPKSDNLESCWFVLNVTDVKTNQVVETFGYGRNYPYEKVQLKPMYKSGLYKFEMEGNLVTVRVTAAKRNPT